MQLQLTNCHGVTQWMLGIYANYSLLNSLVTNSGRILKKKELQPKKFRKQQQQLYPHQQFPQCTKAWIDGLKWLVWKRLTSIARAFGSGRVYLRLDGLWPTVTGSRATQGSKLSEGKPFPKHKLSQLQALPEHSMLCCHLSTCQSSGHPLPCNKPYSFQSRLKGMHVHPPVVPKSLQLEGIRKRATYPPFHREPWAVPQHSAGVQGLALEV